MQLKNNLVMANLVNRAYEGEWSGSPKPGSTISIRKPVRVKSTSGATLGYTPVTEGSTSLAMTNQQNMGMSFLSTDLTLTIEQFSERYIKPAMIEFAQVIDSSIASKMVGIYNSVGTPGTLPSSYSNLADLAERMDVLGMPQNRKLVLRPDHYWGIAKGMTSITNLQGSRSEDTIKGYVNNIAGFDIYNSQSMGVQTQTASCAISTTETVLSCGSSGIRVNGAPVAITAGQIFTVSSCYSVNPVTRTSTGVLQQFVVTTTIPSATSATTCLIAVTPTINDGSVSTTLAYQNVNSLPAAGAACVSVGSGTGSFGVSLAFCKEAFSLAVLPLERPDGAAKSFVQSGEGLSLRIVQDFDITNDLNIWRFDILWATALNYADLAVRLVG